MKKTQKKKHCEVVLWWHDSVITAEINPWQTNAVCSKYKAKPSKPRLAWYPVLVVVKYCDHFGKANFRFSSLRREIKLIFKKKNSLDIILQTKWNVMFYLWISTWQLIQYLSSIQWHKSSQTDVFSPSSEVIIAFIFFICLPEVWSDLVFLPF